MKNFLFITLLIFFLSACGTNSLGGTEAGNPSVGETRYVTGDTLDTSTSSSNNTSFLKQADDLNQNESEDENEIPDEVNEDGCWADEIVSMNSRGEETSVFVNGDCEFRLGLRSRRGYRLQFYLSGVFVTALGVQDPQRNEYEQSFLLPEGTDDFNLGRIQFGRNRARPQHEPQSLGDRDHDGIPDFEDDDDDGDGILDIDETDCDNDGFIDDIDQDDDCDDDNDDDFFNDN